MNLDFKLRHSERPLIEVAGVGFKSYCLREKNGNLEMIASHSDLSTFNALESECQVVHSIPADDMESAWEGMKEWFAKHCEVVTSKQMTLNNLQELSSGVEDRLFLRGLTEPEKWNRVCNSIEELCNDDRPDAYYAIDCALWLLARRDSLRIDVKVNDEIKRLFPGDSISVESNGEVFAKFEYLSGEHYLCSAINKELETSSK